MFICKENYLKLSEIQHSQFLSQFLNSIYQLVQVCWDIYQIVSSIWCTYQILLNFDHYHSSPAASTSMALIHYPGVQNISSAILNKSSTGKLNLCLLFENDSDRFQNLRDLVQVESESSSAFPAQGLIINLVSERENRQNRNLIIQDC
ncbi:Hypothetical_protein [Hexamita inflata]|uniref:Hypothetical_protein n=1 Tax=Hexamita inflata TaxID=28002 RepID=A0AA86U6W7_9EUKA|nr:Hypothetical protein HINF_LOCUS29281 [Hexamita inflata]